MDKLRTLMYYVADRLKEPSTWQGIGFVVTLTGSKIGFGADWGLAAGLGGILSAVIKMVFPDDTSNITALDKAVITANVTADVQKTIHADSASH